MKSKASEYLALGMWVKCEINEEGEWPFAPYSFLFPLRYQ